MDPKRILMIVLVWVALAGSTVAFAQSSVGPASSEPTSQIAAPPATASTTPSSEPASQLPAPAAASEPTPGSQPASRPSPYRTRTMPPRPVVNVAPASKLMPATTTAATTTAPAATTNPTTEPAAPVVTPVTTASAPASAVPAPADAVRNIRLQFKNAQPKAIVEWMCEKMHRNLIGEVQVPGDITIFDSEPYTIGEAFDTVNVLLAMRGFRAVEEGRFLRVVPVAEIVTSVKDIPIYQGMDKTTGARDGELATVMIPLKYMEPGDAAKLMVRLVSPWGTMSPMPTGKGLLITDNMGNIRRINEVLKLMDNPAVSVDRQVKVIELKQAPARDVAQIITGLWGPGNVARKMTWNEQAKRYDPVPPDPAEIVIAQPDERTNTLVLMGEAGRLITAEQMVKDLDSKGGPSDRDMRVFVLKNAKADDLAETIRQSLPAPRPSKFGPPEQARVSADPTTNRIIVSAPVDQMAQIENLIKELDEAVSVGGGSRIFRLQNSDAQQIANVINMAMQKRDPRGRVTMLLSVSVAPNNSVVLSGPQGDINTAAQLIKELDVAEKEPRDIRVVPLKAGDARQVASSLMNVMSQASTPGRPSAGGLRVESDPTSNSLIISASPGDWPTIERFLKQMEEAVPQMTAVTRMLPLQHATATELANTLQQIYNARANRVGRGPATIPVTIAASDRANSLLISASQDDQDAIADLIKQMDVETKEKIDPIVMIELKTADATKLADMLRSMIPPPQGGRTAQPISIMADPSGAAILIRAPEAQRKMIEEMIAKLDKDSGSASFVRETQVLPLKTASATQMVATLNQVFTQQPTMMQRGQTSTASERIIITAAPGDKAVVIDAPKKKLEDIIQLATTLDVPDSAQDPVVMIELKAADANQLVTTLRSLLPAPTRGNEVFLSADTLTNTVLVRAPASQRQMLQDMIAKLDTANVESARERRVHTLKTASANAMVPMLNQLFIQQPASRTARTPDASERIIIAPAPGDKALVIDAPKKKIEEIVQLVDTLDVGEVAAGQLQMRTYILNSANAVELARSLTSLFAEQLRSNQGQTPTGEPQPRFQGEPNSNQLLVAATSTQFETIDKLIEKMEKDGGGVKSEARFFELKHAQAKAIQPMITSVVEADIRSLERLSPSRRRADFQVSADDRTNTLIVTAPMDTLDLLTKLLAKLDSGEVEAMTTQVVALENADANELANTLNAALSSTPGGAPSPAMRSLPQATQGLAGRKISVIANMSSRALVLTGNKTDIEFALGIIKELDGRESVTTPIVQTYKIANGKAETIARVLNESLVRGQPVAPRGQAARPPIQISAEADSNTLVVSAGADVHKTVADILKQLDTAEAAGSAVTVELVKLEFAKADLMATALNLAANGSSPSQQQRRNDQQVLVTADVGSNSLLLTGRPQDIAVKKKLVLDLDKASAQGIVKVKILPLKVAKASELVELLQSMLSDPGAYTPRQRGPQTSVAAPVRVAAQTQTNSIVIQGPAEAIAMAEELVAKFDVSSEGNEVSIQIIQLVNAQAASLAEAVNANIQAQAAGRGAPRATAKPGEDTVTVTPEPNSNSVLIRGPAKEVPAVVEMIKKLDATGTSGSAQVRTYKVVNNDAEELAASLGKLFQDMIRQMRPANGMQPPPFTIGADVRTNTLVVSTTPSYFTMFENLFKQLEESEALPPRDVQFITLYNADAYDVAAKLDSLFTGVKGPDKPIIEADYIDNSLSIIAKDSDLRMMEPIIAKMDKAVRVDVKVFPVTSLKVDKLVEALQQIWPQMSDAELRIVEQLPSRGETNGNGATQPGNGTHVVPIDQNGTNILPADDTVLAGTHTQQAPPASQPTTSQPATKSAVAIATDALEELPENENARPPVVIAIDKSTKSLIVSATRQDMDTVQSLINQLVISGPANEAEIRWFTIKNTDPEAVAVALESLFNPKPQGQPGQPAQGANARSGQRGGRGQGAQAGQPQPQPQPQPGQPGQPGQPQAQPQPQPAATPTITVFADSRTQQLGVRAKPMDFDLIIPVIEQLDRPSGGPITEVRTFPLKNTDATEVAANLRELFRLAGVPANGQANRRTPQQQRANVLRRGAPNAPDAAPPAPEPAPEAAPDAQGDANAAAVDGSTTVSISANRATNTVIISAPADAMQVLASLIEELEQSGVGTSKPVVRLYPIKNADVNDIAAMVQQIFVTGAAQGARGPGRAAAATELPVIVTADEVGKIVIVSASVDKHELIKQVIEDVEKVQGDTGAVEVKVYKIVNSNAQSVATVLTSTLSQAGGAAGAAARPRGGRGTPGAATGAASGALRISADPTSNCIVVSATADEHKQIEALLKDIDSKPGSDFEVRIIALKNADATTTAQTLSRIFVQSQAQRNPGGQAQPAIVIEPNAESRTLMVRADDETFKKIDELVQKIDQTGASNKVYILPLENSRAADMAVKINDLYRQMQQGSKGKPIEPMAVTADERSNSLVIASSELQFKEVSEWVDQLEQMGPPRSSPRIIQLENADPAEVQKAINQLFGGSAPPRTPAAAPTAGRGTAARPAAGATGARPMVTARPTGTTAARPATGGTTGGSTVSTAGGVTTTVLSSARQLLVDASDEDYEAIVQLAKTLDEAAKAAKADVQIFQLKYADNARVATSLTTVMGRLAVAGRPEDQVSVTALPQTKAVVVTASKDKMVTVAELIKQLDKEEISAPMDFKVYALENASPTEVLPQINQMITSLKQFEPTLVVNVTADERTRSIIIAAQTATFAKIDPILKAVDAKPAHKEGQVLVIPLKRADATRLADVLNEMLRPSATADVTPEARALQQQVKLLQVARAGGDPLPDLDLTKPIKINSDPSASGAQGSNSLIITSTAENLKALQAIVEMMDTVPIGEAVKVQLVHLEHADATAVMTTLREIFTQGQTNLAGKKATSVAGKAEPDSVSGKALTNALNISADLRTNTLVLSGVAESLALAELIVKDMDRDDAKFTTEVRLFKLVNADATRLMPVLQAVFAEQAAAGGAGAGAAGATGGADGIRTYATRLQTVLDKNQGNATDWPKTRPALTIQADATTNTLVVAARADIMPLIADVIKTMDIPGAGSLNTVRIFPLVNADATRLQTVINALFTGPNAQFVRNEDKPTIAVDTRANSLVVSASDKTFAMLDALLKKMDDKTPMDLRDMRLLPLKNADSATLAASLQRLMDARVARLATISPADADRLKVTIIADARSNNLMISGSPESYDLIKGLADQLDGASPALSGDIQIFTLKEANAGTLSTTLQNLFTQRYAAAQSPDVARQKPIILADLRVNCLLVAANQDDSRVLASLLAKLDVKQTDPTVQLVVLPLKHNDCGVVGPMLTTLFTARLTQTTLTGAQPQPEDRVAISTDALSNSLIVSASKENIELINGLLEKLDVEPPTETGLVRLYPLKNADASRVATMLQGLVSQGLYKPGAAAASGNASITAREKVAFAVDTRTNVLIVSASKENFAVLEEIINKVDSSDAYSLLSDIRIFTLQRADASRLAPTLQQFFTAKKAGETAAGDTGKSLPVTIVPDPRTNTLLVAGSKESFGAVEAMVKQLDGESVVQSTEFKVFTLKQGTAVALQPIVQQLMAQRVKNASLPLDPVTVMADGMSNTLIVGASPADMQLVDTLISRLDVPATPGEQVRVFPLRYANATQLVTMLRTLTQPTATGAAATTSTLKISADERINAVIVTGGQADMERVAGIIPEIDKKTDLRVMEVRVFTLRNADATELATLLTATLTRKPTPVTPSENPNQQNVIQFITQSPEGKQLITSAVQEGLLITAERSSNALVVTAPMDSMPLLKSLIEALDSVRMPQAEIRYYTLRNADATRMAETLRQLFRMSTTGGAAGGTATQNYTLSTGQPADGVDPASATMGTAEQDALNITVDGRTNTLLISGTTAYLDLCTKIVTELDAQPQQDRLSAVYRLRNARARDVQTAMQTWLDQERQRITTSLTAANMGAAQQMLDREVGIVAVPSATETGTDVSNTLLIWASPRYFERIKTIVDELDQPPPQVLIQVLLAEVTLDDTVSLGFDWNLKSDTSDGKTISVGTNFGMATPSQLNVSVTGGDLTMFLRALETQGRVEVLSRPQVMASDNQQAEVNVGQRVPFVQSTQVTNQGLVNAIAYQQVGIILRVTPRINPDGFIRMQVNPEISSIDPSPLQVSDNTNAIVINNRSAQTTVTVQDGHTIVIGGLITNSNKLREKKVPILGDIPGLGLLFKSSTVEKARTELLIFLTPQVIRTVPAADVATNRELRRMDISPRMEQAVDLEGLFNPLEGLSPTELDRLNNGRGADRKVTSGAVVVPAPDAFVRPQNPEVMLTVPNQGSK